LLLLDEATGDLDTRTTVPPVSAAAVDAFAHIFLIRLK
jgi:hypothetical protein